MVNAETQSLRQRPTKARTTKTTGYQPTEHGKEIDKKLDSHHECVAASEWCTPVTIAYRLLLFVQLGIRWSHRRYSDDAGVPRSYVLV
jgi:hypothetical protein